MAVKKNKLPPCDHDECGPSQCNREKPTEITYDREAIRRELKESRTRHTKRVRSTLP